MEHIILPGLTTTPLSNWRDKIKEIDDLRLEEIALFPTFLKPTERKELYEKLEKTCLRRAPHVHLRDDMEEWELDYFREKYKTDVFNMHPDSFAEKFLKKTKYRDLVFIENQVVHPHILSAFAQKSAGICLDLSHAEDVYLLQGKEKWLEVVGIFQKFTVGCCHISAVKKTSHEDAHYISGKKERFHSDHWLSDLSELDYVQKYVKYLPKYVSIELENSFEEQLKAKRYLEKIINGQTYG